MKSAFQRNLVLEQAKLWFNYISIFLFNYDSFSLYADSLN